MRVRRRIWLDGVIRRLRRADKGLRHRVAPGPKPGGRRLNGLRVVVPAVGGSSPVAHPLRPANGDLPCAGRSQAGQTRGNSGPAKPLDERSGVHVDRVVEPNIVDGLRDPRGPHPGGRSDYAEVRDRCHEPSRDSAPRWRSKRDRPHAVPSAAERDGSADGVLQTGQRIGSAATAVTA